MATFSFCRALAENPISFKMVATWNEKRCVDTIFNLKKKPSKHSVFKMKMNNFRLILLENLCENFSFDTIIFQEWPFIH